MEMFRWLVDFKKIWIDFFRNFDLRKTEMKLYHAVKIPHH